ncbi:GNAT superfamily N-acetyltransferase [Allocatelliglobosispora scoriae]|uniref:GNAT superfamily N-acetyltransferase n=1 Tax=Allocatelliglobosispora scoriae TaxID=643052 RepID=A0A841BKV2_9ACTN|nr:GNAT family N-acetyltransferase [Allocatelliglobosispora scoriae]MBB5868914.1 GNAT superfamily N-acetyltransferase [Allocatelliglobosispora scoriae]
MSRLQVRSLTAADIPDAAILLARRHRAHRRDQPLLSPVYAEPDATATVLAEALAQPDASGALAVRGTDVVGFLLGAPKAAPSWGPNVWVEAAGQAVTYAEDIRDLYAFAAERWVAEGRTAHYVLAPASDTELVRSWFRLGFGHQHCHGLRALPTPDEVRAPRVVIRRAERADIPLLAELDLVLAQHQSLVPTFSAARVPELAETLKSWEDDFDDTDFATFVAEHEGRVVGSAIGCSLAKSGAHTTLARPDNAGFLGFAAVFPQARGLGVGRALGEAVGLWSAESGFSSYVTDWRVTNLLSSRAWPALGFAESFTRLHRLVGY